MPAASRPFTGRLNDGDCLGAAVGFALFFAPEFKAGDGALRGAESMLASDSAGGKYLMDTWHAGTFANRTKSVMYHVAGHGKGRSAGDYTKDAMTFFEQNKSLGIPWTLKDGTPGIKIKIGKTGGYWTQDGRLVTFWD